MARDWLGESLVIPDLEPLQASDDFAFMLEAVPGSYFIVGNGEGEGGCMVHNPDYDFNDAILPVTASYWVKLAEAFLADGAR